MYLMITVKVVFYVENSEIIFQFSFCNNHLLIVVLVVSIESFKIFLNQNFFFI